MMITGVVRNRTSDLLRFPAARTTSLIQPSASIGAPTGSGPAAELRDAAFLDRRGGFLDIAGASAETPWRVDRRGAPMAGVYGDAVEFAWTIDRTARPAAGGVQAVARTSR